MDILFEDNHLIAVNKPFRMPSQGDQTGDLSVVDHVKTYIKETYNKPGNVYLGLLHRLDRVTAGVMLLAKTSKAAARVSRMFHEGKVDKTYYAITERVPHPAEGELHHRLRKMEGKNIMRAYDHDVDGSKTARLKYKVLKTCNERALVEIKPLTGRQHQIRVQLAAIRCPVVGDVKYGPSDFNPKLYIALFAKKLRLEHPVKRIPVEIEAPLPVDWVWKDFS